MNQVVITAFLVGTAATSQAQSYLELGLTQINADLGSETFNQFALSGSVGYNFNPGKSFQNKIEANLAFGIGSDSIFGTDVKLDNYYGLSYRPTFELGNDWEVFGRLAYAKAKLSAGSESETSDFELGYGVGVSYSNISLSYTDIDDTSFVSLGYSFKF
jgi:hypothetical protein